MSVTAAAEPPVIDGQWLLDEDSSEEAEDVFEDKMRRSRYPTPGPALRTGERPSDMDLQQQAYWDTISKGRERRSLKDLRRLGTVYPLIMASKLVIERQEDGLLMTYDELLPRRVRPNPNGKVYSASGDELVADSIGYTLSYWDNDILVLETDPPSGGKYVERVRLAANSERLEYSIKVRSRALEEAVTLKRVFVRATGS